MQTLGRQVAAADVMIALIGSNWADVKDEHGNRRLDNPNDFVRVEIAQALQRDIPVLPVLLDGAPVPRIAQLPQDLMALSLFQAMPMRTESVVQDADAIARRVKIMMDKRRARGMPSWVAAIGAALVLACGVAAGPFALTQLGLPLVGATLPDTAKERVEKAEQALSNITISLKDADAKITELQRQRDAAAAELNKERVELDQSRSALTAAQTERDAARNALANAEARANDFQKQFASANADLEKARSELGRLGSSLAVLQRDRDQARADLASANAKASDLQKQLDAIKPASEEARKRSEVERRTDRELAAAAGSSTSFRDQLQNGDPCQLCPEMVVVPSGNFLLGSPRSEPGRHDDEGPPTTVTIARPFAVAKFAVTFDEWDACVSDGGCNNYRPDDSGWGRGKRPVINVSWNEARAFTDWLSRRTGKRYRLLSETEREYVTRAGTTSPFWWGSLLDPSQANYDSTISYEGGITSPRSRQHTLPVDSYSPNPWGLYNVHGNVWEWTEDCRRSVTITGHVGNPRDGTASTSGDCTVRMVRGGSWFSVPNMLRSAFRYTFLTHSTSNQLGFRVARSLIW